jgi:hypothetical protein
MRPRLTTHALRASLEEVRRLLPGSGPRITPPVEGRHGGCFERFGDYAVSLFENIDLHGDPPSRALFDMAAVAIVRNPAWARAVTRRPLFSSAGSGSTAPRTRAASCSLENFDRAAILKDFYDSVARLR